MTSDTGKDTAVSSVSDDDFFGDIIGYSELIRQKAELESNPNFSGLFSNLQSKANECKLISTSINSLETTLAQARKETASANIQDGIEQKTSDDALEKIKAMEDRTSAIENTFIPQAKQSMQELKICREKLTQQIAKGSGWTNEQEEMRDHLAESHEQCLKEVTKVNSQMAQLRSQVEIKEQEVQSFVKSRDDLNSRLHQLEQDIYNANEQLVASKLAVGEADRNKKALQSKFEETRSDLNDLLKERDEAKEAADSVLRDKEAISDKLLKVSKELSQLTQDAQSITIQLEDIRKENTQIGATNAEMSSTLDQKREEHQHVLNQRAKMKQLRELIDQKNDRVDQERKRLEEEKNIIQIDTVRIDSELPMLAKENESIKRQIKRLSMDLEVVNRKTGKYEFPFLSSNNFNHEKITINST